MRPFLVACSVVACAAPGQTQTTWNVDLLNRPGTDFTDLPAAVAAAAPGDILLVHYVDPTLMQYTAARITRGLSVIGQGPGRPGIDGRLDVVLVPTGEEVFLANLRLSPFDTNGGPTSGGLLVSDNVGAVHLINIVRTNPGPNPAATLFDRFTIAHSGLVTISQCSLAVANSALYGRLALTDNTRVVADQSAFVPIAFGGFHTVELIRSELVLVDSTVFGSPNLGTPGAAIAHCDARILVAGPGSVVVGGTVLGSTVPGVAVLPTGGTCTATTELVADPRSNVGPAVGANVTTQSIPALSWSIGGSPTTLAATSYGDPGATAALVLGFPAATPFTLLSETFYLAPGRQFVIDVGLLNSAGERGFGLTLPFTSAPGSTVWLQGAQVATSGSLALTNPAPLLAW